MKSQIITTIYIVFIVISIVNCSFEKNDQFDNLSCNSILDTDVFGTSRSQVGCSVRCVKDPTCKGFFFNKIVKSCYGVKEILTSSNGCIANTGNVFYRKSDAAPTEAPPVYGNTCSAASDCTIANTICLDSTCQCDAGYRLNSSKQCVTSCVSYGTTYIKYSNKDLNAQYINQYMLTSLVQCQTYCSNTPSCTSINFSEGYQMCRTRSETPLTSPSAWRDYSGVDYYSRNCALYR